MPSIWANFNHVFEAGTLFRFPLIAKKCAGDEVDSISVSFGSMYFFLFQGLDVKASENLSAS